MDNHTIQETDLIRKLNSDLGQHVKNCSFSTNLSGRFYENNSLETHKARAHRVAQMKAKRRQLERSLELEEKKILFLEKTLQERKQKRLKEEEIRIRTTNAAIVIQSQIRGFLSRKVLEVLRVENDIVNYIVTFIQALYRGRKERHHVNQIKMKKIQHRKEELSAIKIQSHMRRFRAKNELSRKIEERIIIQNGAACMIQARMRGNNDRILVKVCIQEKSAIMMQSRVRGMIGRRIRDDLIKAKKKKKEKPKRIPLHERRYSTYSVDTSRRDSIEKRRFSDIVSLVKRSNVEKQVSGMELLRLIHAKNEQKANNEIDSKLGNTSIRSQGSVCTKREIIHENSLCGPKSNDDNDRILRSRQKAAARAAKLKRKSMVEKERLLQLAKDRKQELDQLELNRRNMMRQETLARKEREVSKFKEEKNLGSTQQHNPQPKIPHDACCERRSQKDQECKNMQDKIVYCANFDDNFEDDFQENEFDLDEMG